MNDALDSLGFNTLFEAAADALLLVDEQGQVVRINPAAQDMLGYSIEETAGLPVEMLIPPRFRTAHRQHRQFFSKHPQKRSMGSGSELVALSKDGHELSVDISLSPLHIQERAYVLITFVDATLRRQTQRELKASEERLLLAKLAAGLGIFDYDLIRGTIQGDERIREIFNIAKDEAFTIGKLFGRVHPADRAITQTAIDRALQPQGEGEYYAEFRIAGEAEDAIRWVLAIGKVFFHEGRPARLVGTVQDVSERKAVERRLQDQRKNLEALLKHQVAAQTASAIAHELNQPLAAVSAYSEVALRELAHIDAPEKLIRALNGCVEQSHRAGKRLHELMEFLHKGDLVPERIDLAHTIGEAIAVAQNDYPGGFLPSLELPGDLPPVIGNHMQIQKVLINLLHNGIEAMSSSGRVGGRIIISAMAQDDNKVRITVQDSGPGVSPQIAQRLFEPFLTTKSRGIGMGLVISRTLVEANGGEFWFDQEQGLGARFHFTLPAVT